MQFHGIKSYSCGQHLVKLSTLGSGFEIIISSDLLSVDVSARNSVLVSDALESSMHLVTIRDKIHLNTFELDTLGFKKLLGLLAEWAVIFREHHDLVVLDETLNFSFHLMILFLFSDYNFKRPSAFKSHEYQRFEDLDLLWFM